MKLMVVMAHPDDAEIWCGGTIIKHTEKGDEVRVCILSYKEDSIRGLEAQKGARLMGCEVELLGLSDTAIRDSDKNITHLIKSINAFQPDTFITHWYDDMHPDHEGVFRILMRALLRSHLNNRYHKVGEFPRIFCCDTYGSKGLHGPFKPNKYVDVQHVWEKKINAIQAHRSESTFIFINMIEKQCREHGKALGTSKAEGFFYLSAFGILDLGPPLGS